MAAARAGLFYFLIVFAAGFALGTLRVMLMAPSLGETLAVLVELPVMLGIAWVAAGWLIRRCGVGAGTAERAVMGGLGFGLLMLAEIVLGLVVFARPIAVQIGGFATWPGAIGLGGQIAFGVLPLWVGGRK